MLDLLSGELRQMALGLIENDITLNEAQDALRAVELLKRAGIAKEDWPGLAQATEKVGDGEFREGVLRLIRLERQEGKDYRSLLSHFEGLSGGRVKEKDELDRRLNSDIAAKRNEANRLKKEIAGLKGEAEESRHLMEQELRQNNLVRAEIQNAVRLKAMLRDKGLDIAAVVGIAQELGGRSQRCASCWGRLSHCLGQTRG